MKNFLKKLGKIIIRVLVEIIIGTNKDGDSKQDYNRNNRDKL